MKTQKIYLSAILLSAAACLLSLNGSAQGNNLQFSRVIFSQNPGTCPANSVWKVEAVVSTAAGSAGSGYYSGTGVDSTNTSTLSIRINGNNYYIPSAGYTRAASSIDVSTSQTPILPLWLPEGTSVWVHTPCAVSIIEFNIVP